MLLGERKCHLLPSTFTLAMQVDIGVVVTDSTVLDMEDLEEDGVIMIHSTVPFTTVLDLDMATQLYGILSAMDIIDLTITDHIITITIIIITTMVMEVAIIM